MINRLTLYHSVTLMDSPDPTPERRLKLLTDADLDRILKARDTSGNVNMLHPLEVFLDRAYLSDVVRTSLTSFYERDVTNETDDQRKAVESAMQQRVDFLGWLTGQPEQVYLAVYPADDDGLDDIEDLTELLADEDGPMPF